MLKSVVVTDATAYKADMVSTCSTVSSGARSAEEYHTSYYRGFTDLVLESIAGLSLRMSVTAPAHAMNKVADGIVRLALGSRCTQLLHKLVRILEELLAQLVLVPPIMPLLHFGILTTDQDCTTRSLLTGTRNDDLEVTAVLPRQRLGCKATCSSSVALLASCGADPWLPSSPLRSVSLCCSTFMH